MKKLNVGCGDIILPDYINLDLYNPKAQVKADAREIPFDDNTFDEVYSSHVIEHFDFEEAWGVLKEWVRVIKPEGWLIIETPDAVESFKKFATADEWTRINLYGHIFGMPWRPGGGHKFLYSHTQLDWTYKKLGLRNIRKMMAPRYVDREDICLKLVGQK